MEQNQNQSWMDKKAQELLSKEELDTWLDFIKSNQLIVVKILTIHQRWMARQPAPFFNVVIQAMWMSCIVFACIMAFGAMFGSFPAMLIGCALAALTNKGMHDLGAILHDKLEEKLTKQREDTDGDSTSSG